MYEKSIVWQVGHVDALQLHSKHARGKKYPKEINADLICHLFYFKFYFSSFVSINVTINVITLQST